MLRSTIIGGVLATSLVLVVARQFYESKKLGSVKTKIHDDAGVGDFFAFVGVASIVIFFLESSLYIVLVVFRFETVLTGSVLQIQFRGDRWVQGLGIVMMFVGHFLAFWSQSALNYEQVTIRGPYRYVRHPMYLGFFLIVVGFFFALLNLIALVPLLAIPGELRMATIEEKSLENRFREVYTNYRNRTGKFLPSLLRRGSRRHHES